MKNSTFALTCLLLSIVSQAHPNVVQEWAVRYDGADNLRNAIAIDRFDKIYVTGRHYNAGTGYDYITTKYDSSGNKLWEAYYSSTSERTDEAKAVALDDLGNVYVTGQTGGYDYDYTILYAIFFAVAKGMVVYVEELRCFAFIAPGHPECFFNIIPL